MCTKNGRTATVTVGRRLEINWTNKEIFEAEFYVVMVKDPRNVNLVLEIEKVQD